jgi:N-acetylmuramic acid 6-phosphate etherase
MAFQRITEADSHYRNIEKMTVSEILVNINSEDQKVAQAVQLAIPQIEKLVKIITERIKSGGRLIYIGAGTSGRLGVLDASECVPTFGIPASMVNGIIAGGDDALRSAVEFAEDDLKKGKEDLVNQNVSSKDVVVGLSAGGTTPYVLQALKYCKNIGIPTGSICCNPDAPISEISDFPIEVIVGPEFITGSTRMKSGTAQKMILNMISTAIMINLGRVTDNKMVNMQLSNDKLINRGIKMVMKSLNIADEEQARSLLMLHGSVKNVINQFGN